MSVVRRIEKDNDKRIIKGDHKESSKILDKRNKLMSDIFLIIT